MSKLSRKIKRKQKSAGPPDPLLHKAIAFYKARNWQAADNTCREILRKNPGNHKAMNLLSIILTLKPDFEQAEKFVRRAIQLHPNEPGYYSNLGLILKEQEKWDASFKAFSRASKLNSRDDETIYNLGTVYQALQETVPAMESYRKALEINPDHVQAICALCGLLVRDRKSERELQQVLQRMQVLLSKPGIQRKEEIYFQLAKTHEKLGNIDRVFEFLNPANRLVREQFIYKVESEKQYLRSVEKVFSLKLLEEKKGNGLEDGSPIFIIGMPRSGTTLTEQILGSHSQISAGGELYYLNRVIIDSPPLKVPFRVDTINLPNYEHISKVPVSDFKRMAEAYIDAANKLKQGKKHFTDKMPHNFIHVGMIKLLLPNSRIIHCSRNPMDNALSLYMQHFKVLHPYMYSLEEIGEYYAAYYSLMHHWKEMLSEFILEVRYEDLVNKPEEEIRRLLMFCGLQWEASCLEFYKLKRYIKTASEGQADQPMYTSSIGRWKKYEKSLLPLMKIFQENGIDY